MCIIMVKPAGIELPDISTFRNCESHNSDGMGFMYPDNGKVIGHKGFTKVDKIYKAVKRIPKHKPVIVHFRYATHGAIDGTASHPFPISDKLKDLQATKWECSIGIAHNGVIPGYGSKGVSDTQEYIQRVLSKPDVKRHLFNRVAHDLIKSTTNSKFALLDIKGNLAMIGNFVEDKSGMYYSNTDYLSRYYNVPSYSYYSRKDDGTWTKNQSYNYGEYGYYGYGNSKDTCKQDQHVSDDAPSWYYDEDLQLDSSYCPFPEHERTNCWECPYLGINEQLDIPYCDYLDK